MYAMLGVHKKGVSLALLFYFLWPIFFFAYSYYMLKNMILQEIGGFI